MFSGAVQTLISTPVDLLKIRQQLQSAQPGSASYIGPLQLLRSILRAEGLPGANRTSAHLVSFWQSRLLSDPRWMARAPAQTPSGRVSGKACMQLHRH